MFIAALFTVAKTWKRPKCPSLDDWAQKMWSLYSGAHFSAIRKGKTLPLPFVTTWMDLENIMLSKITQTK